MHLHRRSLAMGALVTALAAAMVVPTAAVAKTRWVDDDGKAGPSTCAGKNKATKTVGPSVIASAAGDVVKVCPGIYAGRVIISGARDRLTVRAVGSKPATLRLPATTGGSIVIIKADDVTVTGFTIETLVGDACVGGTRIGVRVSDATGVTLSGLTLRAVGTNTLSGCKLSEGIQSNASDTTVVGGSITDFESDGVVAFGGGTFEANGLTLTYSHLGEMTNATLGGGVSIQTGVEATLTDLTVQGAPTAGVTTARLAVGVALAGASSSLQDLTVSHVKTGVRMDAGSLTVNGVAASSSETAVTLQSGTGSDLTGVTTSDVVNGILVTGGADATIHDNTLGEASCEDQTSGTGTAGTKHLWTNNTAASSNPVGICTTPT